MNEECTVDGVVYEAKPQDRMTCRGCEGYDGKAHNSLCLDLADCISTSPLGDLRTIIWVKKAHDPIGNHPEGAGMWRQS